MDNAAVQVRVSRAFLFFFSSPPVTVSYPSALAWCGKRRLGSYRCLRRSAQSVEADESSHADRLSPLSLSFPLLFCLFFHLFLSRTCALSLMSVVICTARVGCGRTAHLTDSNTLHTPFSLLYMPPSPVSTHSRIPIITISSTHLSPLSFLALSTPATHCHLSHPPRHRSPLQLSCCTCASHGRRGCTTEGRYSIAAAGAALPRR